jgi:hypothetical protein
MTKQTGPADGVIYVTASAPINLPPGRSFPRFCTPGVRPGRASGVIVSASYRTNIRRFTPAGPAPPRGGILPSCHPYGGGTYRVSMAPGDMAEFVLWCRKLRPLLPDLDRVQAVARSSAATTRKRRPFSGGGGGGGDASRGGDPSHGGDDPSHGASPIPKGDPSRSRNRIRRSRGKRTDTRNRGKRRGHTDNKPGLNLLRRGQRGPGTPPRLSVAAGGAR